MKMSKLTLLLCFCVDLVFSTVVGLKKFPDFNNPENLFKDHSRLTKSRAFDDGSCDKQLMMFSDAFSSRETWALRCKDLKTKKKFI